jgi:hypothetical protein
MANQDTLTITKPDPSGAYSQIETGWNPTYANGAVTWLPSSASITTATTDTGASVPVTVTKKASSTTGYNNSTPDTYQIQGIDARVDTATSVRTDFVELVVTANGGTAAVGTYTLASSEITSISNTGVITFSNGTVFANDFAATITYKADIPDDAVGYYNPIPVTGAKGLSVYHPASGNAQVTAKFQWTDDDMLSIDGVEQATWADLTSASASAQANLSLDPEDNATWAKLDKMKYIRLVVISTDGTVDGVPDVSGVYEHASDGAYIRYSEDRTAESNTGITISGIGADPS